LIISCAIALLLSNANLEGEGSTPYQTVVRAAARLPESPLSAAESPTDIQVLSSDEIARSGATTVQEALQQLPGVNLNDEQGNSLQPDITIRGITGSSVSGLSQGLSVFVDGVRINEPAAEEINFDLIPLDDVERIELIRGPSAEFGRNSLAGTINIVTRRGKGGFSASTQVSAGSFGREKYRLHLDGAQGSLDYLFSVSQFSERGFRAQSDSRASAVFGKLGYRTASSDLALSYQYQVDKIGQAGSLPLSVLRDDRTANLTVGDFFAPQLHQAALNASRRLPLNLTLTANAFVRVLNAEQFNSSLLAHDTRLFNHTRSFGGILQLSQRQKFWQFRNHFLLGIEYSHETVSIRVHEEENERTLRRCLAVATECPLSRVVADLSDGQNPLGLYVFDTLRLGSGLLFPADSLSVSAGIRFDRLEHEIVDHSPDGLGRATGSALFRKWVPTAGLNYNFSEQVGIYLAYKEGFRAPAFLELTCADPEAPCVGLQAGVAPDPTFSRLRPVKARSYEAGLRTETRAWLEASIALYRTDIFDEIYSVSPGPALLYFQNVGNTRRQGVELSVGWLPVPPLKVHLNYTYTRATFESDFAIASPRITTGDEFVSAGARLPLVPSHRVNGSVRYQPRPWATLSLDASYVGDQYFRGDEENTQPKLSPYFLVGAGLLLEWKGFTASVHATNLLNSQYETFGTFANSGSAIEPFLTPGPPIRLFVSLGYRT
jgi:outer membrane receptor protein involved in Fe transport